MKIEKGWAFPSCDAGMRLTQWSGQGLFGGPAAFEARVNRACRDTHPLRPFGHAHSDSIVSQQVIAPRISILVGARVPSAVVWGVTLGIIHALKSKAVRAWSEIGKEVCVVVPPFTDRDASSAITTKVSAFGIPTAVMHSEPDGVFGCLAGALCGAMFDPNTTATSDVTVQEVSGSDEGFLTTRAQTAPDDKPTNPPLGWIDCRELSVGKAGQVFGKWMHCRSIADA